MKRDFDHPKCSVAVLGCSGHGKSTKFQSIIASQKADYSFFFDHKPEFSTRWKMTACDDLQSLAKATALGTVCFVPGKMYPGQKAEGFLFFCDFVFSICQSLPGRKILVCDELQMVCLQDNPPELMAVMDDGRSIGLDTFFIAQSANQVHNMVLNQFTEIITFKQQTQNAAKPLENFGFDKKEVSSLKPGQWIYRNTTTGEEQRGGKAFKIKSSAKKYL